jgi:hypothetical protein
VVRDLPPSPVDGTLFWPTIWSADGALLAGRASRAGQIENIVVLAVATGAYRVLPRTGIAGEDLSMVFVDDRHLAYSDDRALWLREVGGGEPKRLYLPAAGQRIGNLAATRDGRWLSWIERVDESDVWLATVEEGSAAPPGARR